MSKKETNQHTLALMPSGRQGQVPDGTNLLQAAHQLGVELESICGGRQTCGKCQISLETGQFPKHGIVSSPDHLSPMQDEERQTLGSRAEEGRRLACAARLQGDVLIHVPLESQAHKQVIAKAATQRSIRLHPAVRQVYVHVAEAELGDNRGDWERLQQALHMEWDLSPRSIDPLTLSTLQSALRQGNQAVTVTLWQDSEVLRIDPGYHEGLLGLAVDVGSTTVAAHLCDLHSGEVLNTQSAMNPQVRYGEDLMSRISYATNEPQGLHRLRRAILRTLNELAQQAAVESGVQRQDILDVVMAGNTVMHHILLNIDPTPLGSAPFALAVDGPIDLKARDLGLQIHPAGRVHLLPLIAGHVGADNVGVMLAEAPHEKDDISLIIDVGTNAEIILGNREGLLVASSPTGPAFEGAQVTHGQRAAPGAIERVRIDPATLEPRFQVIGHPEWLPRGVEPTIPEQARATGICGSGIIEAVAEMFLVGILDANGHFMPQAAERSQRVQIHKDHAAYVLVDPSISATGAHMVITQQDVRAIQLAKAALYAGARLLMETRGIAHVDTISLAGAFGSFINPRHAMILGMIPDCDLSRVHAVGNAAGDGARIALLNQDQRREAVRLARESHYVETPLAETFQEQFVAAMALPHAIDPFPHIEDQLPKAGQTRGRRRQHRFRETEKNTHE